MSINSNNTVGSLRLLVEELGNCWSECKNGGTENRVSCCLHRQLLGERNCLFSCSYKGEVEHGFYLKVIFFPYVSLAIPDESTKGIASLVAKQRRSHKVRNSIQKGRTSVCSGPVPYRGRVPPILPAFVKSELKDLLAFSPVLLSDFEKAFAKRFGRSFQYMQYGFLSMFEVLSAASDVISVEQTRAGSLLTLKKSAPGEKQRGWPAGNLIGVALTVGSCPCTFRNMVT